jgi:hypothetical protein
MSTIFHIIFSLTMLGFIAGMIKPAWIMRRSTNPGRARIAIIALPVLVLAATLNHVTRTPDEIAQDEATARARQAKTEAQEADTTITQAQHSQLPLDQVKQMCMTFGSYAMTYAGAKATDGNYGALFDNINATINQYPPALHQYLSNTWATMKSMVDTSNDLQAFYVPRSGQTVPEGATALAVGCIRMWQNNGLVN